MAFKMTGWSPFNKVDPPKKNEEFAPVPHTLGRRVDGANPNVDFGERSVNVRSKEEMFEKGLDKTIQKKSKSILNKMKGPFKKETNYLDDKTNKKKNNKSSANVDSQTMNPSLSKGNPGKPSHLTQEQFDKIKTRRRKKLRKNKRFNAKTKAWEPIGKDTPNFIAGKK
tara:strand:- start:193 stop:696 length:504 start_codon:yes stop_codon:yes gene_type:complete